MYIFKAAVVGAGTMGGEIAQVIAASGVEVVLKDIEQKFVDTGLAKAREVSQAQLGGLVAKEKISQEDADRQLEELAGRITGATDYDGFGDVDFVVEAVPERMPIKQAVFSVTFSLTLPRPPVPVSHTTLAPSEGQPELCSMTRAKPSTKLGQRPRSLHRATAGSGSRATGPVVRAQRAISRRPRARSRRSSAPPSPGRGAPRRPDGGTPRGRRR